MQKPRKTRKTSKKKVVDQEVENVNDTDSDEDVKVWVTNKPTENASEDFNSNDASVCDDDVESLSSESESKLLEDADMEIPVETDAGEVHADVGSDKVLQPEQDEDIEDPEGLAPGDTEDVTESREETSVFEEQPDVRPQRIRRPCDRLTYYDWGSSLPSINQINCNMIPQTMGVHLIKYCMFLWLILYFRTTFPDVIHTYVIQILVVIKDRVVTAIDVENSRIMELLWNIRC